MTPPEQEIGAAPRLVSAVMITAPKTLPFDAPLQGVRAEFANSHVHAVLLVRDGVLYGVLQRTDLSPELPPALPAMLVATLPGRTVRPDERVDQVHRSMITFSQRRLAVVDLDNKLLGLLCLKRDLTGFCSDEGVAERARERTTLGEPCRTG